MAEGKAKWWKRDRRKEIWWKSEKKDRMELCHPLSEDEAARCRP